MLVCLRDLMLTKVAAASLLRHADGMMAVTFWDDGSLAAAHHQQLSTWFPGCRVVRWENAISAQPMVEALKTRPLLDALGRSGYACASKLLGPVIQARSSRVVVLDPDAVFFKRPQRLLTFLTDPDPVPLYLFDRSKDQARAVPSAVDEALQSLAHHLQDRLGRPWRIRQRFFNSGLLAFEPARMSLDAAEAYLKWQAPLPEELRTGIPGIWFGPWTPEQTCHMVMMATADGPAPQPFPAEYGFGGGPSDAVFTHFLRSGLAKKASHRQLEQLVADLTASSH